MIQECGVPIFLTEIICVPVRRKTFQSSLLLPPQTGNKRNPEFVFTGAFDRKSEQNLMFLLLYELIREILPAGAVWKFAVLLHSSLF